MKATSDQAERRPRATDAKWRSRRCILNLSLPSMHGVLRLEAIYTCCCSWLKSLKSCCSSVMLRIGIIHAPNKVANLESRNTVHHAYLTAVESMMPGNLCMAGDMLIHAVLVLNS